MARILEWTSQQEEEWAKWVSERPLIIQELARKYPPYLLFRLKSTDQKVFILSYFENGTLKVAVSGQYNFVSHERAVFGIEPGDLEECDLPGKDDLVGNLDIPIEVLKKIYRR